MRTSALLLFLGLSTLAPAQKLDPVQWTATAEPVKARPGATVTLKLTAKADPDWHFYSLTTPPPPIATTIKLAGNPAVAKYDVYQPKPDREFDPNFSSEVEWFAKEQTFFIPVELSNTAPAGPLELTVNVRYQSCDARQCLPPRRKAVTATITIDPAAPASQSEPIPSNYVKYTGAPNPAPSKAPPAQPRDEGLPRFLALAFGLGLAAIFTPCVFPMIPITVSFFLNQQTGSRRDSLMQALVFCLGIVFLFTALGFAITAIAGPFGVVQLGSNPWVNGFIAAIFFAFGLSLLGAFEITLPSGLLTKLDSASRRGGYFGTLLMGLTFSLTSFACVGPFVGTLLAASVQSKGLQPVLGMLFFAAGLATPFFFLALFPSFMQRLPRSGGWMARVKVVMGFIILAAMFKYLSNVDLVVNKGDGFLTRELFLAAWVVLFALPGLYLLGFLSLEGVKRDDHLGAGRLLTASGFLIFAVSLLPAMFGGTAGAVEAYLPPPSSTAAGPRAAAEQAWQKNGYTEALARAKQENKLVLVTFTGYACTNCHWMKANMFTRPEIAAAVKDMVLVELFTDGDDDVSRTNQELQEKTFNTVAIPYYALMDGDGRVIASFPGLTRDTKEFLTFLTTRPQQSE